MKKLHNLTLIAGSILLICLSVSCKKQPDKILNYEGISFSYASYWKAETEQLDETHFYSVSGTIRQGNHFSCFFL
ncbi:hypothetical protein [Dysgonomonas sp. Marseille-P4361]|uniref:hypothetical protein n=1 Tax=Dysgonomonas sp. Marseille-P4361 TaxID=2161820 RepID=UPI00135A354F|nr:hypothetical protein [Dysgonomonas sp. Marseille-P4361]